MRFVVVEDHPLFLKALREHIIRTVEGADVLTSPTLSGGVELLDEAPADFILLDYSLPDVSGRDALSTLLPLAGDAPIIVMSGIANKDEVAACIKAGARAFLPKALDGHLISMVISLVMDGGTYVPAEVLTEIVARESDPTECNSSPFDVSALSSREVTMLRMLISGASNKEIARELKLEEVTVKFYLTRLFKQISVKNRSQAAVLASRSGLTEFESPHQDQPSRNETA